jgi:hypothetical protein
MFTALKIHISPYTKAVLEDFPNFIVKERGQIAVKVNKQNGSKHFI